MNDDDVKYIMPKMADINEDEITIKPIMYIEENEKEKVYEGWN